MPKKIDDELNARAVRLVNDHQGEYSSLTAAAAVVAKQLEASHPNPPDRSDLFLLGRRPAP